MAVTAGDRGTMQDGGGGRDGRVGLAHEWVGACLVGAGVVALFDLGPAHDAGLGGRALLSILELDLLLGLLVGLFGLLFFAVGDGVHRILAARAPRWLIDGVFTAAVSVPLALEMFSGPGVRRTLLGSVGPWLMPLVVGVVAALVSLGARRLLATGPGRRRPPHLTLALAASLLAVGAWLADRRVLVGQYPYLHVLAAVATVTAAAIAAAAVLRWWRSPVGGRFTLAIAAAVLAGLLPTLFGFPADARARRFLATEPTVASRVTALVRWSYDRDGDGASPLLGGGDCDDGDAGVGPAALETPGNGRDEDCDGLDRLPAGSAPATDPPDPYGGSGDRALARARGALAGGRPTVILLIDALRADRVGREEFPNLAALARESLDFRRAYAPAASTFLSLPAIAAGAPLPNDTRESAFHQLTAKGVATAAVAIDVVVRTVDEYVGSGRHRRAFYFWEGFAAREVLPTAGMATGWGGGLKTATDRAVSARAFALLASEQPPELMWVHYFDLHQWSLLEGLDSAGVARYDEVLTTLDQELGSWLARKDQLNLILIADHGEGLGEHGVETHTAYLYRELVAVPLLIRIPGVAPQRIGTPVPLTDLAPTLLDLFGAAPPGSAAARRSLLGVDGSERGARGDFAMFGRHHASIVSGEWRLIDNIEGGVRWLYDIGGDADERHDVADGHPEVVAGLANRLKAMYTERVRTATAADAAPP